MRNNGSKIEVNIMDLFKQIDHKLDSMVTMVALKADANTLTALSERVMSLEINGSNNAQTAIREINDLKQRISSLGWKVAFALATAILTACGSIFVAIQKSPLVR